MGRYFIEAKGLTVEDAAAIEKFAWDNLRVIVYVGRHIKEVENRDTN